VRIAASRSFLGDQASHLFPCFPNQALPSSIGQLLLSGATKILPPPKSSSLRRRAGPAQRKNLWRARSSLPGLSLQTRDGDGGGFGPAVVLHAGEEGGLAGPEADGLAVAPRPSSRPCPARCRWRVSISAAGGGPPIYVTTRHRCEYNPCRRSDWATYDPRRA
jgi:hypothetical protein